MAARAASILGLALVLAGCTGGGPQPPVPGGGQETSAAPTATPACSTPAPLSDPAGGTGGLEVQSPVTGGPNTGQLWGLLFVRGTPIRAGDEVKIIWRMTGTGDLRLTATAPDGTDQPLTFGPKFHPSSTYQRPGQEWGAGYRFTQPGCWTLRATRDDGAAEVHLTVA